MGDHRASIKITMDFHGKKYEMDSWINYCDSDGNGLDSRVIEFFSEAYRDGIARYENELYAGMRQRREAEQKRADEIEYERLKAKFEPHNECPRCKRQMNIPDDKSSADILGTCLRCRAQLGEKDAQAVMDNIDRENEEKSDQYWNSQGR